MLPPSWETIPIPALPAPVTFRSWNTTSRKSPQDSTPNCSALFSVDRIVESCTRMCSLTKVRPRAKSLLNDSASSCASMRELVTSTFAVLMRLTPSRDLVASTLTLSRSTPSQPFISTAKCPPLRKVIPRRVTLAGRYRIGGLQRRAVQRAGAGDRHVADPVAPQQRVVEVAVPVVLVLGERVGLGGVHAAGGRADRRARVELQGDVAFQVDGAGLVSAGGEPDHPAAGAAGGRVDRPVDRVVVQGGPVAGGAEVAHVEGTRGGVGQSRHEHGGGDDGRHGGRGEQRAAVVHRAVLPGLDRRRPAPATERSTSHGRDIEVDENLRSSSGTGQGRLPPGEGPATAVRRAVESSEIIQA